MAITVILDEKFHRLREEEVEFNQIYSTSLIKFFVLAWGTPIVIVLIVRIFTPDPTQSRSDFSQQSFIPSRVWIEEKSGSKGSDHFELRIESPDRDIFFHRDPKREPIDDLLSKFPIDQEIAILYSPDKLEGNILMEIKAVNASPPTPILSFDDVISENASRRRLVYIAAAVWCTLANLLGFALWQVDIHEPKHS